MEDRSECRHGVCTRHHHFTHHVHPDAACISQSHLNLITLIGIYSAQFASQILFRVSNVHSVERNHSQSRNCDSTVRRNLLTNGVFAGTPYIDDNLIARSQTVVLWSSHIHVRFESKILVGEYIASEHLIFRIYRSYRSAILIQRHCYGGRVVHYHSTHNIITLSLLHVVFSKVFLSQSAIRISCFSTACTRTNLSRLIHFLQSQDLVSAHSFGRKFHHQLLLALSLLCTFLYILNHLRVSHSRLSHYR